MSEPKDPRVPSDEQLATMSRDELVRLGLKLDDVELVEYDEPWPAFRARVTSSLADVCAQAGPGGTAVVVTSGGPIAAACAALVHPDADDATFGRLWSRFNTTIVNSSFTRVVVGSTGARILTFNEHPHLEGEHLTYR